MGTRCYIGVIPDIISDPRVFSTLAKSREFYRDRYPFVTRWERVSFKHLSQWDGYDERGVIVCRITSRLIDEDV